MIHCKDCKLWVRKKFPDGRYMGTFCKWSHYEMKPNDFCSKAEPKEGIIDSDDWISVKEDLPKCNREEYKKHWYDAGGELTSHQVLVTVEGSKGRFVTCGRYAKEYSNDPGRWIVANMGKGGRVVAWMEKPEPWGGE